MSVPKMNLRELRFSVGPVRCARNGMFRTSDLIDIAKARQDRVLLADARTAMSDYRLALAAALGTPCDRNGFTRRGGDR